LAKAWLLSGGVYAELADRLRSWFYFRLKFQLLSEGFGMFEVFFVGSAFV
jgi:hypothetical protein